MRKVSLILRIMLVLLVYFFLTGCAGIPVAPPPDETYSEQPYTEQSSESYAEQSSESYTEQSTEPYTEPAPPQISGGPAITASLTASPSNYSGKCPAKIQFNGRITSNAPGTVKYMFERSDGGKGPVQEVIFQQAGSKAVSTSWQTGKNYNGWQRIKVISPTAAVSNNAEFSITCK